ncbi:MAG: DUF5615 family PIN-like protein [Gammaproteobacteria bacterium]
MGLPLDMNLSPRWVRYLRSAGVDCLHWSEVGAADARDRELMQWAERNDCAVMTADLDFSAILAATGESGPSVVQIRADLLTPEALGPVVPGALSKPEAELAAGAIVTLDRQRMRLKMLSLRG